MSERQRTGSGGSKRIEGDTGSAATSSQNVAHGAFLEEPSRSPERLVSAPTTTSAGTVPEGTGSTSAPQRHQSSPSRPGVVFEPAQRTKDKVDSTQQPTLPQRLQGLDDAIHAKMQRHSQKVADSTPLDPQVRQFSSGNEAFSTTSQPRDRPASRPGAVFEPAQRKQGKVDSTQQPTLSQRLQGLDNAIQAKMQRHSQTVDDSTPPDPQLMRASLSEDLPTVMSTQFSSGDTAFSTTSSLHETAQPRDRPVSRPGAVFEPVQRTQDKVDSTQQPTLPQRLQGLDNAIEAKMQRHSGADSTPLAAYHAAGTVQDSTVSSSYPATMNSPDTKVMERRVGATAERFDHSIARKHDADTDGPELMRAPSSDAIRNAVAQQYSRNEALSVASGRRPSLAACNDAVSSLELKIATKQTQGQNSMSLDHPRSISPTSGQTNATQLVARDINAVRHKPRQSCRPTVAERLQARLEGLDPNESDDNLGSVDSSDLSMENLTITSDNYGGRTRLFASHLTGTNEIRINNRSGDSVADLDDVNSESKSCDQSRVEYTEKYIDLFRDTIHEDIECGVLDPGPTNLAVAVAVEDDDEQFLPSAVEYDPDAKPPMLRNRRFRLYACLAMEAILVGVIGAIVGVVLSNREHGYAPPLPDRETLGVREFLATMVGPANLDDPTSPYSKALDWIQYVDPISLTPESPKLSQRFLAAYLYFGTSEQSPWTNGCDPRSEDSTNDCTYKINNVDDPTKVAITTAKRWLSSEDECLWGGITCDPLGQIHWLDLSGSNMTGLFPEGIQRLPFLQRLCLTHGALRGTLPASIGEGIKHLESLELAGNAFTGTIPDSWYSSRKLRRLNVATNALTGTLSKDVGKWKDMTELHIFDNAGIVGTLPDEVGSLANIWWLNLNGNALVGTIPTSMGNLRRCERLSLADNKLMSAIPTEFGLMTSLNNMFLQNNELTGSVPEQFSGLAYLDILHLNDNMLTGSLAPFSNMTAMASLRLERNRFTGTLSPGFDQLVELVEFAVSGNHLTGTVSQGLCNLVKPLNKPGTRKELSFFELDCMVQSNGMAEISCPCCTDCCDPDGENCQPMNAVQ